MALGSVSRGNGGRSSKCFSTVTIVTLLGVCLVGIWTLMSSYSIPLQSIELSSIETGDEVKLKTTKSIKGRFALSIDDPQIDAGIEGTEDSKTEINPDRDSSSTGVDEESVETSSNDEDSSQVGGGLDN